jgi:hypothetical protein
VLEPCDAKVSRTVLRGLGASNGARPLDPAYRADLTYRVIPTEQGKSISLPTGESTSQDGPIAMWTTETGKSEGGPVIEPIEVASLQGDNITSPETELTSPCGPSHAIAWQIGS